MIGKLPRVIPAEPDRPVRAGAEASRATSRLIATQPSAWTPELARAAVERYTALAEVWEGERGGYRATPLADALARGGPLPDGHCLEVGCGTGLLTGMLERVWQQVSCFDLTPAMLRRSLATRRVLADAARLPVADRVAAAVVLADVPLFAEEMVRVLAPAGVVVWCNALGTDAPHHVPVAVVHAALERATPGTRWSAVTSEAGWGLWAVLRRAEDRATVPT